MGQMTQEEINVALFDEGQRLRQEIRRIKKSKERYRNALE